MCICRLYIIGKEKHNRSLHFRELSDNPKRVDQVKFYLIAVAQWLLQVDGGDNSVITLNTQIKQS